MHSELIETIHTVVQDRHKLVILLGDFGSGKTGVLKEAAIEIGGEYLNLNLALSERLLSVPSNQYIDGVTVHRLIDEICDEYSTNNKTLFVDNVEILFSPELGKVNPVDTFKRISRQRVVVLAIPARRQGGFAEYSTVGREDHMMMPLSEYIVIELNQE